MIFVMLYCTLDMFLKVYNVLSIFCNSNLKLYHIRLESCKIDDNNNNNNHNHNHNHNYNHNHNHNHNINV